MRLLLIKSCAIYRPVASWMMSLRASSTWHSPFIDSYGDYQHEATSLLEPPDTPLYKHQRDLPRLPVPTLEQTVDCFLPTALPLAETTEEAETLQQACQDFLENAKPLQERLLQRQAHLSETSWLQEWWNTMCYLQYRQPVVIYVSYFFQLADDASALSGIQRGAAALRAAAEYRNRVCFHTLPQDTVGKNKTPLCSVAYKYMFHACRIAQETQDAYRIHDPSRYTHAVVACRNQFFAVPVFNENGDILPLSIMEANLKKSQEQAKHTNPDSLELGWLTTWNRDDWALARNKLLRLGGPSMQRALELLESGMLVLSLDEEEPVSYRQRALEYWHGGVNSGGNRYFDKSIHLVVSKNGKLGYIGEHSLMDGMPAVGLCNFIQKETYQKQLNMEESDDSMSSVASSQEVENIFDDAFANLAKEGRLEIASLITYAMKDFKQLINDHDLHVESFQGYGSSFIKNAGHSPDAYVQMAIQLATYRLFGKQVATYESTQVRSFLHGRTEVTRSVSKASEAFVKAMGMESSGDDELDRDVRKEKLELFRKATESHVVYIRKAIVGQGCDRHFMGLSMMVDEGEEAPALFSHPLFARSKRWRVSTSTLPNMPGFGPVEEDGVGIAYEIKPNCVMFTITGRREREFTEALCHRIEEALVEIQSLVDMEEPQRSKL